MAKKNPFQKQAGGQPPAEVPAPEANAIVETSAILPEPDGPPVKVDTSKFSKEEAKAFIKEQFAAKIPVFVIALQEGEHPKSGSWKKAGDKFKLEKAELYSHRWMKLA